MSNSNPVISICGIGPGNPDYITGVVWKEAESADILIGGKRQLAIFSSLNKKTLVFDGKTENLKAGIAQLHEQKIVLLVSGDVGFYSLRRFICREFSQYTLQLFPGISSFQYMYARLGLGYENALLASLHGTESDFIEKLNYADSVFLLTDRKNNFKAIASKLVENDMADYLIHIGSDLSYATEKIASVTAKDALVLEEEYTLCSVIIENPKAK